MTTARAIQRLPLRWLGLAGASLVLAVAASAPLTARAAGSEPAMVDCLLPGQIRRGPGGAPVLGPRRSARLSAQECRTRGGEYTVAVTRPVPPAAPARSREDLQIVRCLLPTQLRQLGRKATYVKTYRPLRLPRWDCRGRGGQAVTAARYQAAQAQWQAALAKSGRTP